MKKLHLADILENTSDLTQQKKVGYVAIIGRPNAGKSTFINALLGEKVSITTNVPQTTRRKVLAIHNDNDSQIIFVDTPGIHNSNKSFNQQINTVAFDSLEEADLILYFIDSSRSTGEEEQWIEGILEPISTPIIRVYTKIDLHSKVDIPIGSLQISSQEQLGMEELLDTIKAQLPTGNILFSEDTYTKQEMSFRISEVIREKVFLQTKQEIPHASYVGVEEIEDTDKLLKIVAYVYVETDSQKYIVVGKQGSGIQQIGKTARADLEDIFEKKIFLALRVKVMKNWRKNDKITKKILH